MYLYGMFECSSLLPKRTNELRRLRKILRSFNFTFIYSKIL